MSISILGYNPRMEGKMPYNDAMKGRMETMMDREKWIMLNKYTGKMTPEMIDHQKMYHEMVHGLLMNPNCKIGDMMMGEEDGYDTVTVKFMKPKPDKMGDYDYSSMSMMKTNMMSNRMMNMSMDDTTSMKMMDDMTDIDMAKMKKMMSMMSGMDMDMKVKMMDNMKKMAMMGM